MCLEAVKEKRRVGIIWGQQEALEVTEHLNGLTIRFMAAWQEMCSKENGRSAGREVVMEAQKDDLIGPPV